MLVKLTVAPDKVVAVLDLSTLSGVSEARDGDLPKESSIPAAALPGVGAVPLEVERDGPREVITIRAALKHLTGRHLLRSSDGLLQHAGSAQAKASGRALLTYFIGLAFLWHRQLLTEGITVEAIAKRHGFSASYVHRHLNLAQLSPDILRDALSQRPAIIMHPNGLFSLARTLCWRTQVQQQHRVQGLAHAPTPAISGSGRSRAGSGD
jgi:hypothetical protein